TPPAGLVSARVGAPVVFSASTEPGAAVTWFLWSRPVSHAPSWSWVPATADAGWQHVTLAVERGGAPVHPMWDVRPAGALPPRPPRRTARGRGGRPPPLPPRRARRGRASRRPPALRLDAGRPAPPPRRRPGDHRVLGARATGRRRGCPPARGPRGGGR